ncbi:interferon-stimulated 20 kDa exonuclease-like 2 [Pithys albifrons albifrons]|uniref:interferon-stimulated 20 kDa exonuclease-like 2 n=1 Tax=Pithys albifrons albifrons TaxID=3385563 RepID=UPI003A5D1533
MGDLILNVDFSAPERRPKKKEPSGNPRHRSFVRRRRELERRGVLRQKQLPPNPGRTPGLLGAGRPRHSENGPAAPRRPPGKGKGPGATRGTPDEGTERPVGSAKTKGKGRGAPPGAPPAPRKLLAMDCEMVGTGPGGRTSALARCSIVTYDGDVVYDRYVRPEAPIVDFRTRWSGIRRHHMDKAVPFRKAQQQVLQILAGKVVVGHAIHNDFKALRYSHPKALTRDTSRIPLLNRRAGFPENVAISLKRLTKALLHRDIQVGSSGHSSVEDARATMELYKVVEEEWEQHLRQNPEQD